MAVDMFLKVEGPEAKGESQDQEHKGEIDILAWSWGASQSGTTHAGAGRGQGKAEFQDLSLTKFVDSSSEDLLKAVAKGINFKKVTLVVRNAGNNPVDSITYIFENVIVTSISTGGSGGEDRLTENVTLNFSKFTFKYVGTNARGKAAKSEDFTFDIANNK